MYFMNKKKMKIYELLIDRYTNILSQYDNMCVCVFTVQTTAVFLTYQSVPEFHFQR